MLLPDWAVLNAAIDWLGHGLWNLAWWQIILYTLATTHITIAAVTIFLHRAQAHRALDLHAIPSHFFRFWLWIGTGMVTKEWVAIHRKHHAKCETVDDPHSPQTRGLDTVMWRGAELYRAESKNLETMKKFGHGTPDDWMERNVYTRYGWQGVGIIIGGEELHNNHHTYPTSAKFSVKPYEFDIGWVYITMMKKIGWATVKKVPPKLQLGDVKPVADEKTLEALIANRYEVMAGYARGVRQACKDEIAALKARNADASVLQAAKRWLHRDAEKVPAIALPQLAQARAAHPALDKMVTMREELRQLWLNTSQSREQLTADLQAWCRRAEESGIAALREFSLRLRAAQA